MQTNRPPSFPPYPPSIPTPPAPAPTQSPITPPSTTETDELRQPQRSGVRTPVVVAMSIAAGVLIIGLFIWGYNERNRADESRAAADALEVERADLTAKVTNLEGQLETVANDKARITDEREELRQLVDVGPLVAAAMGECADANRAVALEALELAASFPYGSTYPLESAVNDATTKCGTANSALEDFNSVVSGLEP